MPSLWVYLSKAMLQQVIGKASQGGASLKLQVLPYSLHKLINVTLLDALSYGLPWLSHAAQHVLSHLQQHILVKLVKLAFTEHDTPYTDAIETTHNPLLWITTTSRNKSRHLTGKNNIIEADHILHDRCPCPVY